MKSLFNIFAVTMLVASFSFFGCDTGTNSRELTDEDKKPVKEEEHPHVHTAPHGGHLIELGEHMYNAELVYTDEDPKLTIYILDGHAESPVALPDEELLFSLELEGDTKKELKFTKKPQEKDEEGKSSRYVLADPASLPEMYDDIEKMRGSLTVTIDEHSYTGNLTHDHDIEDNGHAGEHKDGDHKMAITKMAITKMAITKMVTKKMVTTKMVTKNLK